MDELILEQELEGHTDRVWNLAWSPAGDRLASCSGDKSVRIWAKQGSTQTWVCSAVLEGGHSRTVRSSSWSPDGRCLATASFDATTAIWQAQGDDWENVAVLEGHENEVKGVAWSPNGILIATCSRDKSVWIWESEPGHEYACVDVKHGHSQDVKSVTWHPSGEVLVSTSYDDSIKLWIDAHDEWICAQTLEGGGLGHNSTVWEVSFSPDGTKMVSCSDDTTLRIWECHFARGFREPKFKLLAVLSGLHERTIYSADWSSSGLIATGCQDNGIRVFSLAAALSTQEGSVAELLVHKPEAHEADVNCVRWNPKDSNMLASSSDDHRIRLWSFRGT